MITIDMHKVRGGCVQLRPLLVHLANHILTVTEWVNRGKMVSTGFYLTRLAADFGTAFRLDKFQTNGGGSYDVCLDGLQTVCSCPGHERFGYCRHTAALQALQDRRQL